MDNQPEMGSCEKLREIWVQDSRQEDTTYKYYGSLVLCRCQWIRSCPGKVKKMRRSVCR